MTSSFRTDVFAAADVLDIKEAKANAQTGAQILRGLERLLQNDPESPRVKAISLLAKGAALSAEDIRTILLAASSLTTPQAMVEALPGLTGAPTDASDNTSQTTQQRRILVFYPNRSDAVVLNPEAQNDRSYVEELVRNDGYTRERAANGDTILRAPILNRSLALPAASNEDRKVPVKKRKLAGGLKDTDTEISVKNGIADRKLLAHYNGADIDYFVEH